MPVTFTVGTTGLVDGTPADNQSAAAYTPTGTNRYIMGAIWEANTGTGTHTAMRDNGSGGNLLTQIGSTSADCGVGAFVATIFSTWEDVEPPASSSQPYALISDSRERWAITAAAFDGVDQTTPSDNHATPVQGGDDTLVTWPASITVTGLTSGDMVVMVAALKNLSSSVTYTIAPSSGATWSIATGTEQAIASRGARILIGTQIATGSSATFNVDFTGDAYDNWKGYELRAWRVRAAAGSSGVSAAWLTA